MHSNCTEILDRDNFLQIIEVNSIYLRGLVEKREEEKNVPASFKKTDFIE